MDRYAHVGIRDTAAAVARLTLPTGPKSETDPVVLRMTGTDCVPVSDVPPDVPASGDRRGKVGAGEETDSLTGRSEVSSEVLVLKAFGGDQGPARGVHLEG